MNTLNMTYVITRLLCRVVSRLAPRTALAERFYWPHEDVCTLRRVMRKVKQVQRYQPFSDRPGTAALTECQLHRAGRLLGQWLYYQPMNHRLVAAGMCDVNATALSLAPAAWLDGVKAGFTYSADIEADHDEWVAAGGEARAEAEAWLAGQYVDEASMRADFS
jgi:hypothetical protein